MGEVVDEMRRKNRELTSRRAESCRVKVAGWRVNENRSSPTLQRRMMIWECNHGEWMSQQHGIPWEDRSGGKKSFARNARESPYFDFSDGLRLRCRKTSVSWLNLIARIPPHKETLWRIFFATQPDLLSMFGTGTENIATAGKNEMLIFNLEMIAPAHKWT